ncbi:biotin-dependent carboxyltransferase family protein [Nocardioides kongjuensis]|uniref:Urea carboxylase n=1 Tax=Nocardioides kongjuensis TaxID=349522 RepID=A0A852RWP0_9ACTN|nr:biotin-dependent carboxyltransferase family protein [Nocardioides kongjuensis]NYD33280.1 urea carboxylase [Nocardioides kongjuensis]
MSAETVEIIDPGLQTTVQAWPGRLGLRAFGHAASGPMDHVSFRAANALVGNKPGAPGLEVPMIDLSIALLHDTQVAVTGPDGVRLLHNDIEAPMWETLDVRAGDVLTTVNTNGPGFRVYVAVAGGIDVPEVLGSAATSLVSGIGGVEGRALGRGDVLRCHGGPKVARRRLPESMRPRFTTDWEVEVIQGPHGQPDFLTAEDWETLTGTTWRVDLNSDRIGTRLHPHRFTWTRSDAGVWGGHPSNLLDTSYPAGGVLANGDVLTILGADSNTSGGFAVVATVPRCGLWKVGQVRPGRDRLRFREVTYDEARALNGRVDFSIDPARMTGKG